jgi:MFS family permease
MWRLGFFFHEMGFGLLSIFLPLYVVQIDPETGLFYFGIMAATALFAAIPASFFWGYLCDKTRHYKRYILLAFLVLAVLLYSFTRTTSLALLTGLYAIMSIFHVAHDAPKNVLIAELYSHEDWERTFASYEGYTEVGTLIGLLLGFVMSSYSLGPANTLFLCAGLNLIAFVLAAIFVVDPSLIFERRLVSIERTVGFVSSGVFLASKMLDGVALGEKLKKENVVAFCGGLVLFSLATSILFTPLPIFVAGISAGLPAGIVFAIFLLNSGGAVVGYTFTVRRSGSGQSAGKSQVSRLALFRCLLALALLAALQASLFNVMLTTAVLVLLGFLNAVYLVRILSLSMEMIPVGKAGLVNVLTGIGAAVGSLIGPFIAQALGFIDVFVVSGLVFFAAYVFFKIYA